ncbi:DoxX family protein [Actinoallomurus sp. CA-150999]|uniref:DoxX family protein n=1 Tax=Actinoallomurus sp. CA-150999 TaxID=3239887 RepID=UPI003D8F672B
MRPIRTLTRPLIAAPFVVTGIETLRDPGGRAERIAPVIKPLADRVSWLPTKDPEALVRIQGALSVGSGALLAMGRFERLTTLVLAGQLVPSLLAEHRFWAEDDPERRAAERSQFFKTAGLFGALLVVATAPSRHRPVKAARTSAHEARLQAALARAEAGRKAERARRKAAHRVEGARRKAAKIGH